MTAFPPAETLKPTRVRSASSLDDAVAQLGKMKQLQNEITAERDRRIAEINAEYGPDLAELDKAIDSQMIKIGAYVKKNASALFGKKKSTDLDSGRVAIAQSPTSVKVDDEDAAISFLQTKRGKLRQCLRTKVEIDKTAAKKLGAEIPGIRYVTGARRLQVTPKSLGSVISSQLP